MPQRLTNKNLWFNSEVQCPKEKECKGRSRVGEACVVDRARDQAHQQAQNHSHISDHKMWWSILISSATSLNFHNTHLYIEKARKSHLARVVLMDITVVVTYNNDLSCRRTESRKNSYPDDDDLQDEGSEGTGGSGGEHLAIGNCFYLILLG